MRFLRQSIVGFFLASATLGLLIYAASLVGNAIQDSLNDQQQSSPARERSFVVNLVVAEAGTEYPVLEAFGEISSRRTLELRAAVAGRIVSLSDDFADGGMVAAGDALVSIDPADLQSEVDRLRADLADARAEIRDAAQNLKLAELEQQAARQQADLQQQAFDRQVDLAARGVGSATAVETAELAAASAQAGLIARRQSVTDAKARRDQSTTRLSRVEIELENAVRDLLDAEIVAPFDGTLTNTVAVEGGLIAVNEKLADLIDSEDLEVAFRISTAQYARLLDDRGLLVDAPVTVTLDTFSDDLTAAGHITRVNAGAGEGQAGRLIFAHLIEAIGFRPGDFVTVRVEEPAVHDVVRLPATAFNQAGEVLVLGQDDRLEALQVDLVRRQGNDVLVRGHGLAGREVVQQLSPLLGAGISVRPVREGAKGADATPHLLELTDERRARLVAFVQTDAALQDEAKARILALLAQPRVPAPTVDRIERRMGG